MAILHPQQQHVYDNDNDYNPSSFLLDELYCEEEEIDDVVQEECDESESNAIVTHCNGENPSLFPLLLFEHDFFWEDDELLSLFSKEQQQQTLFNVSLVETDSRLSVARNEAVEWLLKVNAHYGFATLTAILAINYLDRFLCGFDFQRDKAWMIQLLAVTCLSLAAKVEETQVPLLLDLQVEAARYVFEAKAIQRMELLVLSALKWKMHLVTPLSFLDHIIRRLKLKNNIHWEFHKRCEGLLLIVVSESRFVSYLPSVLATATMMHVIDQVQPLNAIDYKNQLLGVLKISKDIVNECYRLILELSNTKSNAYQNQRKRKCEAFPCSPSGVIESEFSCGESSNESWTVNKPQVFSSPDQNRVFKKSRAQEQQMPSPVPSLNRVFVDIVGSRPN
ncbi:cyclin-D3-1-like [Mangifera indica]|uniref:cyclin-D3-1-like n=1 Tax=Mangifera indica TaxID=29780 RepID=UPI001CF999CC|nr:cyclin-D3-1-like [Mangifera indica]